MKIRDQADLVVVLGAGSVAVAVQSCVQLPYMSVAAVAACNPAQQLLHSGQHGCCLLAVAVGQVFNYSSNENLQNLSQEKLIQTCW